jgi:hypothetical protein
MLMISESLAHYYGLRCPQQCLLWYNYPRNNALENKTLIFANQYSSRSGRLGSIKAGISITRPSGIPDATQWQGVNRLWSQHKTQIIVEPKQSQWGCIHLIQRAMLMFLGLNGSWNTWGNCCVYLDPICGSSISAGLKVQQDEENF